MSKPLLLLPVENQVRELDAKLLLACAASLKGYRCVIGWKQLIDARLGRFPPAVYLAKSMTRQNVKLLRIKRLLGHRVAAWDEEAVVHYPEPVYYVRRIGADALPLIDLFIAWGEDNRALLEGHPAFDGGVVRVLGNPRADLLRPEFRDYYRAEAAALNDRYGDFILVNTNFGSINAYSERLNLLVRSAPDGTWEPGPHAAGMPEDYARGLFHHRSGVLREMQALVGTLSRAFPDRTILVRPHPSEDRTSWRALSEPLPNVEVNAEGNVIPWLLAASCLVHNGCTTAVEAFLLGRRVISFMPLDDPRYEFDLPNNLGERAGDADAVTALVTAASDGTWPDAGDASRRALVAGYIAALEGEFAVNRILAALAADLPQDPRGGGAARLWGVVRAELRALGKRVQRARGVARYDPDFMRQRFPLIGLEDVQDRADRLSALLGAPRAVRVSRRETDLFETEAA